jgi:hypothetical protein
MRPMSHPSLEVCAWAWIRFAGWSSSFNRMIACIFQRHHACMALLPFPQSLSNASTVLPVCDSETGGRTAKCAYPAGIDLATGEGVFVSPHGAGMSLVSGRWGGSSWRFVPVFVMFGREKCNSRVPRCVAAPASSDPSGDFPTRSQRHHHQDISMSFISVHHSRVSGAIFDSQQ